MADGEETTAQNAQNDILALCDALLALSSRDEAHRFIRDLCTPAEVAALAERWRIASLLDAGGLSYRAIAAETGASTTTVARVARFLRGLRDHV